MSLKCEPTRVEFVVVGAVFEGGDPAQRNTSNVRGSTVYNRGRGWWWAASRPRCETRRARPAGQRFPLLFKRFPLLLSTVTFHVFHSHFSLLLHTVTERQRFSLLPNIFHCQLKVRG